MNLYAQIIQKVSQSEIIAFFHTFIQVLDFKSVYEGNGIGQNALLN